MEKERGAKESTDEAKSEDSPTSHDSLREFVANECKEQLLSRGKDEGENIGEERMNQFFQRAISESERMNTEVSKSRAKQQKLYDELGKERFESWSEDHASQVLTPEQYQSWKNVQEQSRDFHDKSKNGEGDSCR